MIEDTVGDEKDGISEYKGEPKFGLVYKSKSTKWCLEDLEKIGGVEISDRPSEGRISYCLGISDLSEDLAFLCTHNGKYCLVRSILDHHHLYTIQHNHSTIGWKR
jgi:hypothetical protein